MPNIAWGITGASDKLKPTFDEMEKVAAIKDVRITTFITQAGVEILKHASLIKRLAAISDGSPYREIVTPKSHGATNWLGARFFAREYETMLVAPCTSNTLCKFRAGIADSPVTNAAAWATKAGLSVFILQTHMSIGQMEHPLVVRVAPEECKRCDDCPPSRSCRYGAISRKDGFPFINFLKCVACGECVAPCPYRAVHQGERFKLNRRMVDQQAAEAIAEIKGMVILTETRQIETTMKRYAARLPEGL